MAAVDAADSDLADPPLARGAGEAPRVRCALLVADMVESVRLIQHYEDSVIGRWLRFVQQVRDQVLPARRGRLVKSLGDGLLLVFDSAREAVAAAKEMQLFVPSLNEGLPQVQAIQMRIAVHEADVRVDSLDIYGAGVNLVARLATLARPGEIIVSMDVADALLPGIDAEREDLGECYLKHLDGPVRAFRLVSPAAFGRLAQRSPQALPAAPLVAVMPLQWELPPGAADGAAALLGQVLADDLCMAVARCGYVRTLSRVSTLALCRSGGDAAALAPRLGVDYVLEGRLHPLAGGWDWRLALREVRSGAVIWEDRFHIGAAMPMADDGPAARAAVGVIEALTRRQVALTHAVSLPNLPAYSLLLSAIARLHRLSRVDVAAAHGMLEHLVDRHPQAPDAHAWLAKWHFLQVSQAASAEPERDVAQARRQIHLACERDPRHGLSAALDGHLAAWVDRDLHQAEARLNDAVAGSPNEPLAWLFLSNTLAGLGRGAAAVDAVERSAALSPLDPMRYFFDLFAANAYAMADRPEDALVHARRSVAGNALQLSGLVQLIICLVHARCLDEARGVAARYLALRPQASVQRFVDHHVCVDPAIVRRDADALLEAGLPL